MVDTISIHLPLKYDNSQLGGHKLSPNIVFASCHKHLCLQLGSMLLQKAHGRCPFLKEDMLLIFEYFFQYN